MWHGSATDFLHRKENSDPLRASELTYYYYYTPSMLENETEKNMETEMEAGNIYTGWYKLRLKAQMLAP